MIEPSGLEGKRDQRNILVESIVSYESPLPYHISFSHSTQHRNCRRSREVTGRYRSKNATNIPQSVSCSRPKTRKIPTRKSRDTLTSSTTPPPPACLPPKDTFQAHKKIALQKKQKTGRTVRIFRELSINMLHKLPPYLTPDVSDQGRFEDVRADEREGLGHSFVSHTQTGAQLYNTVCRE